MYVFQLPFTRLYVSFMLIDCWVLRFENIIQKENLQFNLSNFIRVSQFEHIFANRSKFKKFFLISNILAQFL